MHAWLPRRRLHEPLELFQDAGRALEHRARWSGPFQHPVGQRLQRVDHQWGGGGLEPCGRTSARRNRVARCRHSCASSPGAPARGRRRVVDRRRDAQHPAPGRDEVYRSSSPWGPAIRDFLCPDFVLIGESDPVSGELLEDLFRRVCENEPAVAPGGCSGGRRERRSRKACAGPSSGTSRPRIAPRWPG